MVEDAIAGIEVGCAGGFGLVIGVDHSGRYEAPREAGAHFVVASLAQVEVTADAPSEWFLGTKRLILRARESAKHFARWAMAIS
jgi:hypothetical protein